MTIAKGFLRRKIAVNQQLLFQGVILWITISYVLYAFLYIFREAFRILTDGLGGRVLLVLDQNENFIYNLFYASIASTIGYMFSLSYVLNNSQWRGSRRERFYVRRTLTEEGFLRWSFLLWFGSVTSMLGVWYIVFPLQFDIDFLKEFPQFLILLPLTLFMSTWPSLRLIAGPGSFKWLGVSFGIFIMMSLGFAMKDFLEVEKINHSLRKNSIEYSYDLKVPKSESQQSILKRYLVTDLFIVSDSINRSDLRIYLNDASYPIKFEGIRNCLNREKDKLDESEREQLIINLHIDNEIKMSFVNDFIYELRKSSIRRIQYSTGAKHSKYPSTHPLFKYLGIHQTFYPWYPEFTAFLDSAENLDLSKYSINLPESAMYRVNALQKYNRVEVKIDTEMAGLNGKPVQTDELRLILYRYMKKYAPNFVVIYTPSDEITYGNYIEYLDLIHSVNDKLRNEMSIELYSKPFEDLCLGEERDNIRAKFPSNIVQWTSGEKRLIELLKKADNRR